MTSNVPGWKLRNESGFSSNDFLGSQFITLLGVTLFNSGFNNDPREVFFLYTLGRLRSLAWA
jgi:hypothetical protein